MLRTHTCWELNKSHTNQEVTLCGWVNKARNLGGMIFIDVRDRYGLTQVTLDPQKVHRSVMKCAEELKNEFVIKVKGNVVARPDNMINEDMTTGQIEIIASDMEILNTCEVLPFPIVDDPKTSEENRMKHRYLDLRRRPIIENMKFRAKMNHFSRNWFVDNGFLEIQTPVFTVSSPEWAKDFLVPSRLNPGKFYALPQAPQQYKQLLMVGGIDRYFQIAPCFRDEDPRADRAMCEFYQIDFEMSFVEQEDVLQILEGYHRDLVKELVPHKRITTNFERMSYKDAMDNYGIDRPDVRFGMKLVDLSETFVDASFSVFKNAIDAGGVVKAIKLEGQSMTRKEIDALTEVAKAAGAGGLAYIIFDEEQPRSPIIKFLADKEIEEVKEKMGAKTGDIVFFAAGKYSRVSKVLHKVRMSLRDKYQLVDNNELAFLFVIDFPFYEYDDDKETWDFGHNPFSMIDGGMQWIEWKELDEVTTFQYDLILNGYELGSGSIRNPHPDVMVKAFEKLGKSADNVKEQFKAMYTAFKYGAPPHGGFAIGFDRLMMILIDEQNIKSVYAFPKSGNGEDVMMGAPSAIEDIELKTLHIATDLPSSD